MNAPRTTRRQAQAADRREQLLKTAFDLFSEQGYRGTSMRSIARRAGVNEGLLYHYFTGKADLFAAVLAAYAPTSAFDVIVEASQGRSPGEVLQEVGYRFLATIRERQAFAVAILTEAPTEAELQAILKAFLHNVSKRLADVLMRYQADGQVASTINVQSAAQAFLGSLVLHFLASMVFGQAGEVPESESEHSIKGLVEVLLLGLLPRR